jgi:hypothetical protein
VSLVLWVAMAGGIATAVAGAAGYLKGRASGYAEAEGKAATERAEAERAHHADMGKLRADAAAAAASAAARDAARVSEIDRARKEGQDALAREQAQTRRLRIERDAALARAADAARVRDEALARAATGGVAEGDDTLGACRARADGLGRALGEVLGGAGELLRSHQACSLDLEDASGAARALLRFTGAVESSERADEVTR